jgi:hypothetical protein
MGLKGFRKRAESTPYMSNVKNKKVPGKLKRSPTVPTMKVRKEEKGYPCEA